MAGRRATNSEVKKTRRPPAKTPEDRENQLVALAVDVAEEQLRNGTASSQVITHYLKMGSTREKLEQERMQEEIRLQQVRREALASEARVEGLMQAAIDAMRGYKGEVEVVDD